MSDAEKLEAHLDTDEGNALDLVHARKVYVEKRDLHTEEKAMSDAIGMVETVVWWESSKPAMQ